MSFQLILLQKCLLSLEKRQDRRPGCFYGPIGNFSGAVIAGQNLTGANTVFGQDQDQGRQHWEGYSSGLGLR
jgi:hypothetical protein